MSNHYLPFTQKEWELLAKALNVDIDNPKVLVVKTIKDLVYSQALTKGISKELNKRLHKEEIVFHCLLAPFRAYEKALDYLAREICINELGMTQPQYEEVLSNLSMKVEIVENPNT